MNRKSILGTYATGIIPNSLGMVVILITAGFGHRIILRTLGFIVREQMAWYGSMRRIHIL
jgi:hypothetical protein